MNRPITTIPLDHITIDELHLFLRIFDVLLRNLIMIVIVLDKELRDKTAMHLTKLVNCIKSCGVSFNVWESDTNTPCHEWTSLTGESKRKVLKVQIHLLPLIHYTCTLCIPAASFKDEGHPSA